MNWNQRWLMEWKRISWQWSESICYLFNLFRIYSDLIQVIWKFLLLKKETREKFEIAFTERFSETDYEKERCNQRIKIKWNFRSIFTALRIWFNSSLRYKKNNTIHKDNTMMKIMVYPYDFPFQLNQFICRTNIFSY